MDSKIQYGNWDFKKIGKQNSYSCWGIIIQSIPVIYIFLFSLSVCKEWKWKRNVDIS